MKAAEPNGWNGISRLLHWLMALLILVQFALGGLAKNWHLSPTKLDLFVWHKSLGITLLALVLVRIAWRMSHSAPKLPPEMPGWEVTAARLNQFLIYALLLAMPISGWIINSAANIPFRVFWWFELPDIIPPDNAVADDAKRLHLLLFIVLSVMLMVHIAAALNHHFHKHNDVLVKMIKGEGQSERGN